ncbi:hypothetical protein BOX15_Mlig027061g1 [Macrostomum lignano]|uniref:Uncharacterized protein n=1 Tax=Macrostomum lignano TaxID=282301 RepID=A0A267G2S3_9PLAT|nr:hypothetical protein BOX15_Mlig027061g1 [Macrostomum lignano]
MRNKLQKKSDRPERRSMTVHGCYYDNASFLSDDEEQKQQLMKQQQLKQSLQQQAEMLLLQSTPAEKPTLLALSRTSSFRFSPSSRRQFNIQADSRNAADEMHSPSSDCSSTSAAAAMDELLARQIDQQRLSQPPLSRNPSVRYSRRFPPPQPAVKTVGVPASSSTSKSAVRSSSEMQVTKVQVHQSSAHAPQLAVAKLPETAEID